MRMKLKKRTKKLMIAGAALAIIVIVLVVSFSGKDDKTTVVQADLAFTDDISEVVTASGRIQPQTKVDIVAEVSAEIIEVSVKEGEWVTKGQTLLLLDTVQLKSDVAQARFSLDELSALTEAARTQYEMDKQEYERQSRLFEQNLTSEMEHTNARLRFENSEANHQAMMAQAKTGRARLEKAEDNLTKTRITAPMDGVVTFLNAEAGEIAQAQTAFTQGQALMTISDLSVFEVEIDVDETEIAKVKANHESKIRVDAFRDTAFAGTVSEIGNSALIAGQGTENFSTSFRVKVRFTEAETGIRPGMSATVDITTAEAENALLIPYAAVVTREFDPDSLKLKDKPEAVASAGIGEVSAAEVSQDSAAADTSGSNKDQKKKKKVTQSGVFIVKDGVAKFAEVSTGIADERNIVALSGVQDGDTIVSGSFQTLRKLADGDKIAIDENSLKKMKEGGD
jgi:HlyD family secretion protein